MKYTEQAVETLDDAGSVIANKNIEIEQLRQCVSELEKEQVAWRKFIERANNTVSAAEAERDELLAFVEEVRRTGDTRLASMAIAAIASVKGGAA